MLQKYLRKADLFGQSVELNIKNKLQHRTVLGGLISIFTIIFTLLLLIDQFIIFALKKKFILSELEIQNMEPGQIEINKNNYMFGVAVNDFDTDIYKQYFTFSIEGNFYERLPNNTIIKNRHFIPMENCTSDHFSSIGGEAFAEVYNLFSLDQFFFQNQYFKSQNLQHYMCPLLNYTENLRGIYNNQYFEFLRIVINKCNSTQFHCSNEVQEQIYYNQYENFQVNLVQTSASINPSQTETFSVIMHQNVYFTFHPKSYYTSADIFLRKKEIEIDNSIWPYFQDNEYQLTLQMMPEDIREYPVFQEDNGIYGKLYIRLSTEEAQYKKFFMKIEEYCAYVGGILKFTFTIIGLLITSYNKYHLWLTIANRLFNYEIGKSNEANTYDKLESQIIKKIADFKDKQIQSSVIQKFDSYKQKETIRGSHLRDVVQNGQKSKIDDYEFQSQSKFLLFLSKELAKCKKKLKVLAKYMLSRLTFRYLFYDNDNQIQMIDSAVRAVKKELDVFTLIDRSQAIEKMKTILLNENQIDLFNHLPKPVLRPRNIRKEKLKKQELKLKLASSKLFQVKSLIEKSFYSFQSIKQNKHKMSILEKRFNKILFLMLGPHLKRVFKFCILLPKDVNKSPINRQDFVLENEDNQLQRQIVQNRKHFQQNDSPRYEQNGVFTFENKTNQIQDEFQEDNKQNNSQLKVQKSKIFRDKLQRIDDKYAENNNNSDTSK